MSLSAGARLGPYEILAPLGAGGMGEVWKARDTRLPREVAIKVLPAALSSDAERLRRFEKEARAASSLNHPAIVTIYEVGQQGSVSYLAMEWIDGATLRDVLAAGPLPLRRLLSVAAQAAEGLAKAHAAGIVHRDFKPENVMLTKDGYIKILDFGLAKVVEPEPDTGHATEAATLSAGTEPGIVLGTVGYMSPEQARGGTLDFRSDQFALGSVLYEMATGRRAFSGETRPELLAAILRDDPPPIAEANPKVPPPLRWIIERCLAKDPAERYASTEDLARDLRSAEARLPELSGWTSGAGPAAAEAPARRRRTMLAVAAALLAGAVLGAIGFHLAAGRSSRVSGAPSFQRVTFQRGNILHGRFAPDGETILYGASWEGRPTEIFSTRIHGTESRALGLPKADLAAVSPSGELLLLLKTLGLHDAGGVGTLARAPLSGGAPREIAENVHGADWLTDGGIVAQRHVSARHDELQIPPGTRKLDYMGTAPRVSRDGAIAIFRGAPKPEIVVLNPGGAIQWTSPAVADVIAWHPNGEIWLSRTTGQSPGVFAVARGRPERPILKAHGWVLHDIAPDGRLLMERAIQRRSLLVRFADDSKNRELSWLDGSDLAGVSTERRAILFSELNEAGTGAGGVYLRPVDGSPAVRLADGFGWDLSEDGKWAFVAIGDQPRRYSLVPTSAGQPVPIDLGSELLLGAAFLPGAEPRLLVSLGEGVDRAHVEIVTPAGRRSLGISPGFEPQAVAVSPDGASFAYATGKREVSLCRIDKPACRKAALPIDGAPIQWSGDGRFLYLRSDPQEIPARVSRYEIATGSVSNWLTLGPEDATRIIQVGQVFVSRDGKSYAFNPVEVVESSLFVIEGLK